MSGRGLSYWGAKIAAEDGRILYPLIAEIAAQPGFVTATYTHIRGTLALNVSNPMTSRLANDGARLLMGYIALYMDAKDGLTRSAIRDLFVHFGISSPGRAAALLMHLRFIKFIELDPDQPDRRSRRYIPTSAMKQAFIELMSTGLAATGLIEPEAASLAPALRDPVFFKGFVLSLGDSLIKMIANMQDAPRDMFADATSGYLMLYRLMIDAEERKVFPPRGPLVFARSALAKEFRVSRSHVSRTFDLAASRGLVTFSQDRSAISLTEPLRSHLVNYYGAMFLNNIRCGLAALAYARARTPKAA